MAAPDSKTNHDMNGNWVMNKSLTGDTEAILVLQGVGWLTRKAIGLSTITLHIKQYTDEQGQIKIDIEQTGTGGIKGTTELRTLNWQWGEHSDGIFGAVKGRSRMLKLAEVADETTPDAEDRKWLSEGWEDAAGDFIQSWAESVTNGWSADQIWGFQKIDGERRYCRNVVVRKGDQVIRDRLVYDYSA